MFNSLAFQKRKHELASKIQAKYKGLLQRRKYLAVRKAVIRIQVGEFVFWMDEFIDFSFKNNNNFN